MPLNIHACKTSPGPQLRAWNISHSYLARDPARQFISTAPNPLWAHPTTRHISSHLTLLTVPGALVDDGPIAAASSSFLSVGSVYFRSIHCRMIGFHLTRKTHRAGVGVL